MNSNTKKTNRFTGLMQVIRQESTDPLPSSDPVEVVEDLKPLLPIPPVVLLPRTQIHRDPDQDRRFFDPAELQNMAASIQAIGIIDPLSVRPRPRTLAEYDLLAGEKRYRAAEIAALAEVPVRVFEVDDNTADDIKAISNLQRSDLNKWEETNAIMGMLTRHLQRSPEEVVQLLNQAANQQRGLTSNVVRKEDWEMVLDVFTVAGRLTPESYRKHRVPLLKLPAPIQDVLQQGKLHYTKINEILKVKDLQQQQGLLNEAIAQDLSVDALQARVKSLRQAVSVPPIRQSASFPARLTEVVRRLKQAKPWENLQKRDRLEVLLQELEDLASQ